MTDRHALRCDNLIHDYRAARGGPRRALDRVDLRVPAGTVHGLLGPNGAGKTTVVRILSTLLVPTAGSASVMGHDVVRATRLVRRAIGLVLGGERGLYNRVSAEENLRYWAGVLGLARAESRPRVAELLEAVGLRERRRDRVETFSRGMKQRLHLARALVGDPPILLLDEPTSGMDPVGARDFRTLIRGLVAGGKTVLLTTHDMREAQELCSCVTLLDDGRVLGEGTPDELGQWLGTRVRVSARGVSPELAESLSTLVGVTVTGHDESGRLLLDAATSDAVRPLLQMLATAGVTDLRSSAPELEEIYLRVFGAPS